MKKPKPTPPTEQQLELEERQRVMSAQLDSEENLRRKRLLAAAQGIRAYRGSPLFRATPGNRSGGVASGGGGSAPSSVIGSSYGGRAGGGRRSVIP